MWKPVRIPTVVALLAAAVAADTGEVLSSTKISALTGGLASGLSLEDRFGSAAVGLGDLDGDGVEDVAVGIPGDDDGGPNRGSVIILFMNTDGTIRDEQKISDVSGGFTGALDDNDRFGGALAVIGDISGDGVIDLAVGAQTDDDGGAGRGAIWLLALNTDGTVQFRKKVSSTEGGFTTLDNFDSFGTSIAALDDVNGDGTPDIAVGAPGDDDGGQDRGAVYVLFLAPGIGPALSGWSKISSTSGDFPNALDDEDFLGWSLAGYDDANGDGITDLAIGAPGDDDGAMDAGAVWLVLVDSDGSLIFRKKVSAVEGNFNGFLDADDEFGISVGEIGDVDGDGVNDLAVGAGRDDDGGLDTGAVYILTLTSELGPAVISVQKISELSGNFGVNLDDEDRFGTTLGFIGDLDDDELGDIVVGAVGDDDGGFGKGAAYVLFLDGVKPAKATQYGSGVNPADSITVLAGPPSIGETVVLGLDNPLGTQGPNSATVLVISALPDPNFPAGTLLPGFGMSAPGASGELLVSFFPFHVVVPGGPWVIAGTPVPIGVPIPNDPVLVGFTLYAQGILNDPLGTFGIFTAFTDAVELRIGF